MEVVPTSIPTKDALNTPIPPRWGLPSPYLDGESTAIAVRVRVEPHLCAPRGWSVEEGRGVPKEDERKPLHPTEPSAPYPHPGAPPNRPTERDIGRL